MLVDFECGAELEREFVIDCALVILCVGVINKVGEMVVRDVFVRLALEASVTVGVRIPEFVCVALSESDFDHTDEVECVRLRDCVREVVRLCDLSGE